MERAALEDREGREQHAQLVLLAREADERILGGARCALRRDASECARLVQLCSFGTSERHFADARPRKGERVVLRASCRPAITTHAGGRTTQRGQ